MELRLGTTQLSALNFGSTATKLCVGDVVVWNDEPTPPAGDPLYLEDEGATLVIGTAYSIPTKTYTSGGEVVESTTYLSEPLKIGNLTQSSYSDNYYYSPQLSQQISHTSFSRESIASSNYLNSIYQNRTQTTTYPTVSYDANVGTSSSGNKVTQTATYATKLTNIPEGYENAKLSSNFVASCYPNYSNKMYLDINYQLLDSTGNTILAESSLTDKEVKASGTTYISVPKTPEISIPTNGTKLKIIMVKKDDGSAGQAIFHTGKMNFWLTRYKYNTPLYCNISRTIYENYDEDSISIAIDSNDTNSQYMVSLTEQGVATISDKQ